MSFKAGKNTAVLMDQYDLSAFFDTADVDNKLAALETTTFKQSAKTFIAGLLDASGSLAGLWDPSAGGSDAVLNAAMSATSDNIVSILPQGDATLGNAAKVLKSLQTDYKVSTSVSGAVKISATVQPDGGAWGGVLSHPLQAEAASGDTTAIDNGASTANGAIANLHITAASGTTPSGTIKIQHSVDNTTWVDLITFNAATAAGAQQGTAAGTVNRYTRTDFAITGTTPSFTFAVTLARK